MPGDLNGLRIGTPELVRPRRHARRRPRPRRADRRRVALQRPETVAPRTRTLRARFQGLHYVNA
ncbi:hypothetical protein MASR1M65_04370 [Saprospiraceae bacterium]